MAKQKASQTTVNETQLEALISTLRKDPALFERIKEVVELSCLREGQSCKIDAVEEELVAKINKLGQQTLSSFGQAVEQEAVQELRQQKQGIQQREKKR